MFIASHFFLRDVHDATQFLKLGRYLSFAFGSSIDSVRYVTTMRFCSRVMPRSSATYGAIGVSLILCANVVIIVICLGFDCKDSENRVKYKINRIYFRDAAYLQA